MTSKISLLCSSHYCSLGRKRRKGSFEENFTFEDSTKRVLLSFSILLRPGSENSDLQMGAQHACFENFRPPNLQRVLSKENS